MPDRKERRGRAMAPGSVLIPELIPGYSASLDAHKQGGCWHLEEAESVTCAFPGRALAVTTQGLQ